MIGIFVNEDPYDNTIDLPMPFDHEETISLSTYPACISTRPSVCYEIKTYANTVELADNTAGYVLSYQNCCRAVSQNVLSNASTLNGVPGATYTATIPGTQSLAKGYNSSAVLIWKTPALFATKVISPSISAPLIRMGIHYRTNSPRLTMAATLFLHSTGRLQAPYIQRRRL